MAEDRLENFFNDLMNPYMGEIMLECIEKAYPKLKNDEILRDKCVQYLEGAPSDKPFSRASALTKFAAAISPKEEDDSAFQQFLKENAETVQLLAPEEIEGLRLAFKGEAENGAEAKEEYKFPKEYTNLNDVLDKTLPQYEKMAQKVQKAMLVVGQAEDAYEHPEWTIAQDQIGYGLAYAFFNNEFVPKIDNVAGKSEEEYRQEAKIKMDEFERTSPTEGLKKAVEAIKQKSAMAGMAMELLGEMHPNYDTMDKTPYREMIKDYPDIATVGLLREQMSGNKITSIEDLQAVIYKPENVVLVSNNINSGSTLEDIRTLVKDDMNPNKIDMSIRNEYKTGESSMIKQLYELAGKDKKYG